MSLYEQEYKVVVLGAGAVGKSALIIRFLTQDFLEEYEPTIEDSYRKSILIDDKPCVLDILDTSAAEQDFPMQEQWIREGQVFLIVYSIISRSSFEEAKTLRNKILQQKQHEEEMPPIVLVGNKCDLNTQRQRAQNISSLSDKIGKPPSRLEGEVLSRQWGHNVSFFEVSAKDEINHEEIFFEAVRLLRAKNEISINELEPAPIANSCCNSKCTCIDCGKSFVYLCLFGWLVQLIYICITDKCCTEKRVITDYQQNKLCYHYQQHHSSFVQNRSQSLSFYAIQRTDHDEVREPILSLKNFKIIRLFSWYRFIKSMCCGIILPIVILCQTIAFVIYSENTYNNVYNWLYPAHFSFDNIHKSLLLDLLGLVVGRYPNQDPDASKDRVWFLRQNMLQKLGRMVITVLLCIAFLMCYYNLYITVVNNDWFRVSLMESIGPFVLFWTLWLLLSCWIAYESILEPPMPSTLRLRSIKLYLGENFKHVTDAHKYIRAYGWSRNTKWRLPATRTLIIIFLGLLYASIPGITRLTVGDASDTIEAKTFISSHEGRVQLYALMVNFTFISSFIYAMEVQYNKHFENYSEWMYALTMLLNKTTSNKHRKFTDNEEHYISLKGINFSKSIFLSLMRKSNALGWLEIRSFLAAEGQVLFAEQELPTLWILLITISLCIFLSYRVFFIDDNPLQSILFNGSAMLCIICLLSLIRIAITGYQFESIQRLQERLLGEQRFFMRCTKQANNKRNKDVYIPKKVNRPSPSPLLMGSVNMNNVYRPSLSPINSLTEQTTQMVHNLLHVKTATDHTEDMLSLDICLASVSPDSDVLHMDDRNQEQEEKYSEQKPLLKQSKHKNNDLRLLMTEIQKDIKCMTTRSDSMHDESDILGFIDNMLFIVERKDIFPRLYKIKLNSILATAIACVFVSAIAAVAKLLHAFG